MDFKSTLRDIASKMDIDLSPEMLDQFYDYYLLLIEKNKVMNLTAITEEFDVITKHFVDSIAVLKYISLHPGCSFIDIGTGAGFPGMPIKIACPDCQVLLLDSLRKRVDFLNDTISKLGLENITAIHGRAEELARNEIYREKFDFAVSRAVARLNILAEYSVPFVKNGGYFVSYKSIKSEEEVDEAKHAIKVLGCELAKVQSVTIPELDADRNLVMLKKIKFLSSIYPRLSGKIKKEPL